MKQMDNMVWNALIRVANVAHIMGINEISLEESPRGHMVRGFDATHGAPVIINHVFGDGELNMSFSALALNDCTSFISKVKLAESRDNEHVVNIEINSTTNKVDYIQFKGKKFKLEFVAGKPETVRAPKAVKDTIAHTFVLSSTDITSINQSVKAMGAEDVTFLSDGTNIFAEVRAGSKDVMSIQVCEDFESVGVVAQRNFVFSYPFKTLFPVLSHCDNSTFNLTTRGMLNCTVNNINVYVIPRIL